MNWIIWTIGWFAIASLEECLYIFMDKQTIIKRNDEFDPFWRGLKICIWVMGMIKFW